MKDTDNVINAFHGFDIQVKSSKLSKISIHTSVPYRNVCNSNARSLNDASRNPTQLRDNAFTQSMTR